MTCDDHNFSKGRTLSYNCLGRHTFVWLVIVMGFVFGVISYYFNFFLLKNPSVYKTQRLKINQIRLNILTNKEHSAVQPHTKVSLKKYIPILKEDPRQIV